MNKKAWKPSVFVDTSELIEDWFKKGHWLMKNVRMRIAYSVEMLNAEWDEFLYFQSKVLFLWAMQIVKVPTYWCSQSSLFGQETGFNNFIEKRQIKRLFSRPCKC